MAKVVHQIQQPDGSTQYVLEDETPKDTPAPMPASRTAGVGSVSGSNNAVGSFGEPQPEPAKDQQASTLSTFWNGIKSKINDAFPQKAPGLRGLAQSFTTAGTVLPLAAAGSALGPGGTLAGAGAGLALNKFINRPEQAGVNAGATAGSLAANLALTAGGPETSIPGRLLLGAGKPGIESVLGRIAARAGLEGAGAGLATGSPGAAAVTAGGSALGQGVMQGGSAAAGLTPKNIPGQQAVQTLAGAGQLPVGAAEQAGNIARATSRAQTSGFAAAMKGRSQAVNEAVGDLIEEAVDGSTRNAVGAIQRGFKLRGAYNTSPSGAPLSKGALDLRDRFMSLFSKRGEAADTDKFVNAATATPEAVQRSKELLRPNEMHTLVGYMIDKVRQDSTGTFEGMDRLDGKKFSQGLSEVIDKVGPWINDDQKDALQQLGQIVNISDPSRAFKTSGSRLPRVVQYIGSRAAFHLAFTGLGASVGGAGGAAASLGLSVPLFVMYKAALTDPQISNILVKAATENRPISATAGREILTALTGAGAQLSADPSDPSSLLALPNRNQIPQ